MTVLDLFQMWLALPWYHILWLVLIVLILR